MWKLAHYRKPTALNFHLLWGPSTEFHDSLLLFKSKKLRVLSSKTVYRFFFFWGVLRSELLSTTKALLLFWRPVRRFQCRLLFSLTRLELSAFPLHCNSPPPTQNSAEIPRWRTWKQQKVSREWERLRHQHNFEL